MSYERVPVTQIKVGDIISVNTGSRPFDDENCKVLEIKRTTGMFGDEQISFFIASYTGAHWYDNPIMGENGQGKFEYVMYRAKL